MIVGCTLDYCIICVLFMKLMTKGKGVIYIVKKMIINIISIIIK
jgi:hypothetical protein